MSVQSLGFRFLHTVQPPLCLSCLPPQPASDCRLHVRSCIVSSATGEVVEEMDRVTEGFILHSFDLDDLESERKSWGLFRDRRPEMYGEN